MTIKALLAIVLLFLSQLCYSEETSKPEPAGWAGIGMAIPSLENDTDGLGAVGAYRALSSWTALPKEQLEKELLDYSVVRVAKPESGEAGFVKATDIIDGKYKSYYAIMPQAYVDASGEDWQPDKNSRGGTSQSGIGADTTVKQASKNTWSSELIIHLGYMTLGFAALMLIVSLLMGRAGMETNSILRINGLILVVTSAVFLVIIGYSQEQISPVIGLLGAVAGYLLGSDKSN